MSRAAAVSNERLRSKNELRASRTAGWELERKRFERLPFSILEPSRPALCETISAVDRPRRVRFKRNLRGLATVRAHPIKHLTRAAVVAAASASSAASVFVYSLPTVRPFGGPDNPPRGPPPLKAVHHMTRRRIDGNRGPAPKLMKQCCWRAGGAMDPESRSLVMLTLFKVDGQNLSMVSPRPREIPALLRG